MTLALSLSPSPAKIEFHFSCICFNAGMLKLCWLAGQIGIFQSSFGRNPPPIYQKRKNGKELFTEISNRFLLCISKRSSFKYVLVFLSTSRDFFSLKISKRDLKILWEVEHFCSNVNIVKKYCDM